MKRVFSLVLFALAGGVLLCAQDISGTIDGSILDPTGAAVPNAKVTITNIDRGQVVRTITTDATGTYSAPIIPIGNYEIKVEAAGFQTVTRSGIVLNVRDRLKLNITLAIGQTTQTVDVHETATPVQTGSITSSTTITGTQVRELSLRTRNYEQLVSLMPGVTANSTDELYVGNSAPSGFSAVVPFSVNGNRNSANNWTVDGADNVDRGSNLTLMMFPSVDAVAEFKVERGLYSADSGRAGGAQVNVATKSGTNAFHGDLYEFLRNNAMAANNWENNATRVNAINGVAQTPPLRWNDFGGTIGGPVYIPGHYNTDKNKTFFFFSEEARRIITYTTFNPILPTQGMLAGNFPQAVCLTTLSGCAAGSAPVTQIPASMINPIAAQYLKDVFGRLALPSANTLAATTSGFYPQRNLYDTRQEILRIDHSFNEKLQLWGRYENDSIPTTEPGGLFTGSAIPDMATTNTNSPARSYVVHLVDSIRPDLLNDVAFNFTQSAIHSTPVGLSNKSNNPDINVPEPFANTQGVIPELTFTGGSSVLGYGPYNELNRNYNAFDNLTWIKGRHTFKFGISVNRYNKSENAANQEGVFGFTNTGAPTGTSSFMQSWANFLLGNVASFTMPSTDITPNLWAWQEEAWAQDDFKVTPRLTIYMGVRWSYFGQPTDSNNLLDNFAPGLYNPANAPQMNPTNGNLVLGTGTNPTLNGIIVGGKNSPYGATVANNEYRNFAPRIGVAWDPFGDGKTAVRAGYGIYYDSGLFGTYEQNIFANPPYVHSVNISNAPFSNVSSGTVNISAAPLTLHATQIPALVPYVQQWSFNIQRQLPSAVVLDVGYVGTKGTHLLGIVDLNEAYPGVAQAAGLNNAGTTIFTSATDPRINAVRPFLGFNAINTIESAFDSNYNALQVMAHRSFGSAGLFSVAYTYSKNLTDNASDRSNAPQNSYNWHEGEYGPATLDRTHVLSLNYVYDLPFLKNRRGALGYVLGGWELSGIGSFYTGSPFTVTTSNADPAGLGLLGPSAASSRPDMVCGSPNANAPHQYTGFLGAGQPSWFNRSCFQAVPQGVVRPGNAGRGVVRGPGFSNLDLALMKNFALLRNERLKLQLRGEAFNALNLVNPNGFASTSMVVSSFGQINTFREARVMQVAAKLMF